MLLDEDEKYSVTVEDIKAGIMGKLDFKLFQKLVRNQIVVTLEPSFNTLSYIAFLSETDLKTLLKEVTIRNDDQGNNFAHSLV